MSARIGRKSNAGYRLSVVSEFSECSRSLTDINLFYSDATDKIS